MSDVILPPGWSEILPGANPNLVKEAFELVTGTFPKRYLHYEVPDLMEKMAHVRKNASDDEDESPDIRSLRIFTHRPPNAVIDIAIFFFLRFRAEPRGYSISLGIAPSVTANTLYNQLIAICRYLQQEQKAIGGIARIDVLSHKLDLVADLDDVCDLTYKVGQAFASALNNGLLGQPESVRFGAPWPSRLYLWQLAEL